MSQKQPLAIAPSILSADFAKLGEEVRAITAAGADLVHVDVMDGHFVPNLTIGPDVLKALKPHSHLPFDVHLMISPVDPYIDAFVQAGADYLTVHVEAGPHVHRSLQAVKAAGCKAGVTLNPGTPVETVLGVLDLCDLVLVMSVNPGFGGQSFIDSQIAKIERLRQAIDASARPVRLEVDGGVKPENAGRIFRAGADTLVAGSAVFAGGPARYAANIRALRDACVE
ncbi:MAG: ribulose-phosphate 3-epimerase [Alphaproteobacteria bacterium]|nr:ribulose-phosphate 3-epimerase [Alphaproteobacteria bacterium]MCB9928368.1 ribulose-phosphate 3-epimerase [Alphaproteobacteria bacterium]